MTTPNPNVPEPVAPGGIGAETKARPRRAPLLLFLCFGLLAWWANSLEPHVPSDHVNIATMVLKDQHPELFEADLGFSDASAFRFYTPAYRKLIARLGQWTGSLLTAPQLLTPLLVFLYLLGAFRLFHFLTDHRLASVLTALVSLPNWKTLMDSWGLNLPENALPRSLFLAFTPWMVLGLLRARGSLWRSALIFFGIGILANLHPVSAFGLTQVLLLTLLAQDRFRPLAFLRCLALGAAATIPTLGFALLYWKGTQVAPSAIPYDIVRSVLEDRVAGFFPFSRESVMETALALAVPAGFAVWGWRLKRARAGISSTDRWFVWFGAAAVLAAFAGTGAIQLISEFTETKPLIFDQMRTLRFVYLPLFVFMAFALAALCDFLPAMGKSQWVSRLVGAVVLFVVITSFPAETWPEQAWNRWVHAKSSFGRDGAIRDMGEWVRAHTPEKAIIDFDSVHFRFHARRSLAFCKKDGGILLYSGSDRLLEWHRRFLDEAALPEKSGASRLAFARKYGANFLVLENRWKDLPGEPIYKNGHYSLFAVRVEPAP